MCSSDLSAFNGGIDYANIINCLKNEPDLEKFRAGFWAFSPESIIFANVFDKPSAIRVYSGIAEARKRRKTSTFSISRAQSEFTRALPRRENEGKPDVFDKPCSTEPIHSVAAAEGNGCGGKTFSIDRAQSRIGAASLRAVSDRPT